MGRSRQSLHQLGLAQPHLYIYIVWREKHVQQQRKVFTGCPKKKVGAVSLFNFQVQKYILPGHKNVYSAAAF